MSNNKPKRPPTANNQAISITIANVLLPFMLYYSHSWITVDYNSYIDPFALLLIPVNLFLTVLSIAFSINTCLNLRDNNVESRLLFILSLVTAIPVFAMVIYLLCCFLANYF